MYLELLILTSGIQKLLLDAYQATNLDKGIGHYALWQLIASLDFFERTSPPEGCAEVHGLSIESQRLALRILAIDLESDQIPEDLLDKYKSQSEQLAEAIGRLQKA